MQPARGIGQSAKPHPVEESRTHQGAPKGVILMIEPGGELRVIAGQDFQSSWVHGLQRRLPFDDVQ